MCAKLLVLPPNTIQSPTTTPKTGLDDQNMMRSMCVCQTSGIASKDYSVPDNDAKNLISPYVD